MDQRWVPAHEAAAMLGVQLRTLYAYASRGRLRSMPGVRGRARLYALADLERLKARTEARSGHGAVAAGALRWGEPVLESAITELLPSGPSYRGHAAVDLAARGVPFETVAELLWSGYLATEPVTWPRSAAIPLAQLARLVPANARPLEIMSLVVQVAALDDPQRRDPRPDAIVARGRRVIPLLAASLAPELAAASVTRALTAGSVAAIAARALDLDVPDSAASSAATTPPVPMAVAALNAALVLLADHELNASSFAARVCASTEADPYAVIAAALATLSGRKHGGASEDVARFADEVGSPEGARAAVRALRARGQVPPGFGHPIYPHGDPRATPIFAHARAILAAQPRTTQKRRTRALTLFAIVDAMAAESPTDARTAGSRTAGSRTADARTSAGTPHALHANVDVAVTALIAALGAPAAAGPALFAIARCAGWLAHALEQRTQGFLLRPRARYTGPRALAATATS